MFNEADSVHFRLSSEQKQEDSREPVNDTHITSINHDRGIASWYWIHKGELKKDGGKEH